MIFKTFVIGMVLVGITLILTELHRYMVYSEELGGRKRMTLDEAISHAEDVAATCCDNCRADHLQLAEWLKELKERRANDI